MKNPFKRLARSRNTARNPDSNRTIDSVPSQGNPVTQQYPWIQLAYAYLPRKFEQVRTIDVKTFKNTSLSDLIDLFRHNHPEAGFAIWQFLRVANSGVICKAKTLKGEDSKRGQNVVDRLLWNINHPPASNQFDESKGIDLITGQLLLNTMLRGGAGCELVLNRDGKMARLQPFDAKTIYFATEDNRLVPYQMQNNVRNSITGYVKVDYQNVFYEPLDPDVDDPYGASPLVSLVQTIAWQISFINDLQAAVHQTGYPRMDATILEEVAAKNMPADVANDPEKRKKYLNDILEANIKSLRNLEPDQVPIHWDSMKLDILNGSGQAIKLDAVISLMQKSLSASLKTLSSIIGLKDDTSQEGFAADLKLYSRGIESIQKVVENLLEKALTMALNLEGVQGWVDVSFTPVDLRSELQVVAEKQTKQDIVMTARFRGAISDYEEMKAHRELLGLIGEPDNWESELLPERRKWEETSGGPLGSTTHGSPPATQ